MSFNTSKTAVSRLVAQKDDEDPTKAKSRDDYRKAKELEEARKLAQVPAAVDEDGNEINPHIPQYISDMPWYLDPKGPSLKHQRPQPEFDPNYDPLNTWYLRGRGDSTKAVATKYRKGACDNCGGMGHKKKECLEKPRKIGAKFSGAHFAPDDVPEVDLNLAYDGKRDRWNGYQKEEYKDVLESYKKLDEVKQDLKKEGIVAGDAELEMEDDGAASSDDEDEDKYVDKMDMQGTKMDAKERYTVRNLRIREDTAKYLRNLDPNSAYYDPKTRAMHKNPYEGTGKGEDEVDFAGDNTVRVGGDTISHAQSQLFAWDAGRKGLDVHVLAEPTKLAALKAEYSGKKEEFKDALKNNILEKYGGAEHLAAAPRELIFAQTEDYVEYTRHGKILRGDEVPVVRSRYEEDLFAGNHTTVWGSYWNNFRWGYKCCHSFIRNSYCTGLAGKEASETTIATLSTSSLGAAEPAAAATGEMEEQREQEDKGSEEGELGDSSGSDSDRARLARQESKQRKKREKRRRKKEKKHKKKKRRSSSSGGSGDSDDGDDAREKKVKRAMKRMEAEDKRADNLMAADERKRPYNSINVDNKVPDDAEMEAYYRKRPREEDPMANFM